MCNLISEPNTVSDFFDQYPEALQRLGAVLRPLTGIMRHTMQAEGLDYSQACTYWVAECFALRYEKYLTGYADRLAVVPGLSFLDYVLTAFVFRVRSHNEYAHRRQTHKAARGFAVDGRDLDTVASAESHKALAVDDCQTTKAIRTEALDQASGRQAALLISLKNLSAEESYIVWNHSALGFTYEHLADVLGMSPTTCRKIHRGAIARLKRVNGSDCQ